MDWANRFPYLVPVWQSISNHNLYKKDVNDIDPNFDIDFGGIGTFNDINFKNYKRLSYKLKKPMLPFFVNNNRICSKFYAYNCLAFSPKRNVLFSSTENSINHFVLKKKSIIDLINEDLNDDHEFAIGEKSNINPFSYNISKISTQTESVNYILDIRVYETENDLELLAQSRDCLNILTYQHNPEELPELKSKIKFNTCDNFFPSSQSFLNTYDRNLEFLEQILTSFVENDKIYRYNIETNDLLIENALGFDVNVSKNRLINIKFLNNLNPFLYIYGTHSNIFLGDTRQKIDGSKTNAISLLKTDEFFYFKPFELIQTFTDNPCESHQFITTSDFHINFFDLRYPNKNLFQCKHMLNEHLVNSLLSVSTQLSDQSNETLLLMASNNIQTRLFNFNCKLTVQPIMLNVPFNVESPQTINKYYPFSSENTFNRGMQILPSDGQNFFTISFLLNNGDIYMQDFCYDEIHDSTNQKTAKNFDEFKYENNIGNKVHFSSKFDFITKHYMNKIVNYVEKLNSNEIEFCDNCVKASPDFNHCAMNESNLTRELQLQSDDQLNKIISTNGCKVLKNDLKFRDKDRINFNYIKENWYQTKNDPNIGIRQYCGKLTQKLFDQWCNNGAFNID